ncbi:phosphate acetyltransferase [sulfur-oxidizing endosymbiont of Gigantopelta aegis]|uniref:phosphate acetyltransferase n=1 Tax=sulfur-oxidizing endosymbiont of Gigantopelta aegis TaxID=2794934 RepID=UPI0018DE7BE9|nr:phosphate acetyltransferase [sulfur-oxidizing endosymbiont of Gigantopelta aegis]
MGNQVNNSSNTDTDIELIRNLYCPDMPYEDCYAFTVDEVSQLSSQGRIKEFYASLLSHFNRLKQDYDFILCEGLNSRGFLASFDMNINLNIAKNLACPFVSVINGATQSDKDIQEEINIAARLIKNSGCFHFASFVNRIPNKSLLGINQHDISNSIAPTFFIPEKTELDSPSLADIKAALNANCVMGSADDLFRVVKQVKIATMTVEHFLNYIEDDDLIIVGGDRADILLASLTALASNNFPNLSGILLTGGFTPQDNMLKLLKGMTLTVPILSVPYDTFKTTSQVEKIAALINHENKRKIALALGHFDAHVDAQGIFDQANIHVSKIMTPIMFEHNLFERAKAKRMTIVLPEATDERILRAVEILLRRQVAHIILLGNEASIQAQSASLGLDIQPATIIDPEQSEYLSDYTQTLFELRQHKGLTLEGAADAMADYSYFATMMVHKGHADGMVSGAIHTTGDTIRPALQIIKTTADISIVSSVFMMCLETQVLVYGDCAVNPDPNASQLAEIAISSAQTAAMFGIEPRVAMLSYSTGGSGKGADVDKVREATHIAQQTRPELLIEGPMQYDAAISPDVAQSKLPDSKVAGNASVFIFPDLNTGNNTYKAVQRSSGAIAIGPILQGLNKPVNDLSRGCLVADIINTVAITAIQAQEQ